LIGLVVLTAGAEVLVRGAVGLAAAVRISPLVIGLTVVAFGTSAPELVVSLRATLIRIARSMTLSQRSRGLRPAHK
jgi:cation:H+ antiporter